MNDAPRSLAGCVDEASEAIRAANHAARGPVTGPDAYAVVGSLTELVQRLPQLVDHLVRGLRRADPAEHYDDRGRDPADALQLAHGALLLAGDRLTDLALELDAAHNHLGHLGRHTKED
jgi:hypothetical protein